MILADLKPFFASLKDQTILVVGDMMLDHFIYGDVGRISPEAPVPVLQKTHESLMPGGAGNVVMNLAALGVQVLPFGVIGQDRNAERLKGLFTAAGVDVGGIVPVAGRPTITKTRFQTGQHQLLRVDEENTENLPQKTELELIERVCAALAQVKVVILSDYGKGVLSQTVLHSVIKAAKAQGKIVLVDPKGSDYSKYQGVDYITPNRKELAQATQKAALKTTQEIEQAALELIDRVQMGGIVATRSEDGLSVIQKGKQTINLPAQVREVYDVSGAGDTVMATLAAFLSAGAEVEQAAYLANCAAGIAVSKIGTTPVSFAELCDAIDHPLTAGHSAPIVTDMSAALDLVSMWKARGLKVGFTNGCFDIVHKGHVSYLNEAKAHCDRLIVALNHDQSVRMLKGPTRPVNDEMARASVIAALGSVDMVVFFGAKTAGEDNTPCAPIAALKPDIFFKGGDYTIDQLPEAKIVHSYGGDVALMAMHEGYSTTSIIAKAKT